MLSLCSHTCFCEHMCVVWLCVCPSMCMHFSSVTSEKNAGRMRLPRDRAHYICSNTLRFQHKLIVRLHISATHTHTYPPSQLLADDALGVWCVFACWYIVLTAAAHESPRIWPPSRAPRLGGVVRSKAGQECEGGGGGGPGPCT